MRGSQPGAFDVAHALRDGTFWETAGNPADTGETYDLIVVGGGISGLAAAYFYRKQAGPKSRILILDNHDDFGGHARRNEFRVGKRLLLSNGGTQSIESPSEYSEVAKSVLQGSRDRDKKILQGLRSETLLASGDGLLLRQGNLWRRPRGAGHGLAPLAGVSRQDSASRKSAAGDCAALHREKGLPARSFPRGEAGSPGQRSATPDF